MFFKNICVMVLWTKVASAFEGSTFQCHLKSEPMLFEINPFNSCMEISITCVVWTYDTSKNYFYIIEDW